MAGEIDKEVRSIISDCYGKAKAIISDNMDILHRAASLLMEKEKLTGKEFDALFREKQAVSAADLPAGV
jgi:cell division protease FtsH